VTAPRSIRGCNRHTGRWRPRGSSRVFRLSDRTGKGDSFVGEVSDSRPCDAEFS
jgi:hypothetical protein